MEARKLKRPNVGECQSIYSKYSIDDSTHTGTTTDLCAVIQELEQRLEAVSSVEALISTRLYTEDDVKEIYEFASTCHLPTGHGMSWEECKKHKGY